MSLVIYDSEEPRFDPFRRLDRYGPWGATPQPVLENIRLVLLGLLLVPLRFLGILLCCCICSIICTVTLLLPVEKRVYGVELAKIVCRLCIFSCGFIKITWVSSDGKGHSSGSRNGLIPSKEEPHFGAILSNHVSWCDILVFLTKYFPSFVAKEGTEKAFIIGNISKMLDCVYVPSSRKAGVSGAAEKVKLHMEAAAAGKLEGKRPLLLFPEGMTSNGTHILPFKSGAFLAGVPVKPVVLRYGKGRTHPAWESLPAGKHVFLMLATPLHYVTVYELPVYVPSAEEKADPRLYASNVRDYMARVGGLKVSNSTLADKQEYHSIVSGAAAAAADGSAPKKKSLWARLSDNILGGPV